LGLDVDGGRGAGWWHAADTLDKVGGGQSGDFGDLAGAGARRSGDEVGRGEPTPPQFESTGVGETSGVAAENGRFYVARAPSTQIRCGNP
jgi:hypothetical protein